MSGRHRPLLRTATAALPFLFLAAGAGRVSCACAASTTYDPDSVHYPSADIIDAQRAPPGRRARTLTDHEGNVVLRSIATVGQQAEKYEITINGNSKSMLAAAVKCGKPVWVEDVPKQAKSNSGLKNLSDRTALPKKYSQADDWVGLLTIVPVFYNRRLRGVIRVQSHVAKGFRVGSIVKRNTEGG